MGAVFLDLKRAFDTVNHGRLISKLSSYNMSPQALSWFESYLQGREQCVVIDHVKSAPCKIKTGIPQGTILGPVLFSLYVNELPEVCPEVGLQMYADDTVVYVSGKSPVVIGNTLTKSLEKVSNWLNKSCLTLNLRKTKSMCFSIQRTRIINDLDVKMNGELIDQVEQEKYLGVILDSQLNFKSHIKNISRKMKVSINCFRMIRNSLTFECAHVFLNTMIMSHLSYCTTVWSQTSQTTLKPIERLYNCALKILDKKPIRFHHCYILSKHKILNFVNFVNFRHIKLFFKCLTGLAPEPLCKFVNRLDTSRSTRAATGGDCKVPFCKTYFAQNVFSVKGANLWNCLPTNIKTLTKLSTFKKLTKDWLIEQQQCDHAI